MATTVNQQLEALTAQIAELTETVRDLALNYAVVEMLCCAHHDQITQETRDAIPGRAPKAPRKPRPGYLRVTGEGR